MSPVRSAEHVPYGGSLEEAGFEGAARAEGSRLRYVRAGESRNKWHVSRGT